MQLNDKVIVVTGAAGGVGKELVSILLQKNNQVAAIDINDQALKDLQQSTDNPESRLSIHCADISNKTSVMRLVDDVLALHGRVDCLINNAGIIQPFLPISELEDATVDRILAVNLIGTIYMTRAFLPCLNNRPVAHIANVSSLGGLFAFPNQSFYGVAKAGVKLFSESLYTELRKTNIGVSVLIPGAIRTDITKNSGVNNEKLDKLKDLFLVCKPDAVARKIVYAIEADRFSSVIGIDARIFAWISRISSKTASILMARIMAAVLGK